MNEEEFKKIMDEVENEQREMEKDDLEFEEEKNRIFSTKTSSITEIVILIILSLLTLYCLLKPLLVK